MTVTNRRTVIGVLWWLVTIIGPAFATQVPAPQESVTISQHRLTLAIGTWISAGETRWAHDASTIPGLGNPTSELSYEDHGTKVIELTGRLLMTKKWFGQLVVGVAGMGSGGLTDDDYGSIGGQRLFSSTHSDLAGDGMWYLNAGGGFQVAAYPQDQGWLEVFGEFQYWKTTYQVTGVTQVTCNRSSNPGFPPCDPPGMRRFQGLTVITNTTTWHSIRLGASTEYRPTRRLALAGTAAFRPLSIVDNEDIHHLRTDLERNPSISMLGYGIGVDGDAGVSVMLSKAMSLDLSYRVWWNHSLDGTATFHGTNGSNEYQLTQLESLRHGLTAGLHFTF